MTLATSIQGSFRHAVQCAFPEIDVNQVPVDLTKNRQGTYSWPAPVKIAYLLGQDALSVAERLKAVFHSTDVTLGEVTAKGVFVVAIKVDALARELQRMSRDARLGVVTPLSKRVIVDLSAPNIAKELHVGHLRSTIIGDVLARIEEFLGHDVLRLNHIGDWGTQFGMLICFLREHHIDSSTLDLPQLMKLYQASRKQFDADPEFKTRARAAVAQLQGGEEDAKRIWEQICQVSRVAFQKIYDDLDVRLEERGESFYNPLLEPLVSDLLSRNIAVIDKGAACVFDPKYEAPYIVRKSDGGYSYDTTDLAALKHRIEVEKAQRLIYVVDAGQSQHFEQLRDVAIKAGILDPTKVDFQHVGFGVVLGPDGHKYKTRSGEVALLRDLVEEAITRAGTQLRAHDIDSPEEAKKLGIGALKYFDLKSSRIKTYTFDPDRLLELKGNTAAYIFYVIARIHALKAKTGGGGAGGSGAAAVPLEEADFELSHPAEKKLAAELVRFPDVIAQVDTTLEPHHLCEFLYHVAEEFHGFYNDCAVIEGGKTNFARLRLCDMTDRVLRQGLNLLGITPLERM